MSPVGRPSTLLISLGALLLGGVALAQQGMIVEPWQRRSESAPTMAPVAAPAMPASGLEPIEVAPAPVAGRVEPAVASPATDAKWSPPVVELLVDPWARTGQARGGTPRPRWVPPSVEIVDPWGVPQRPHVAVARTPGPLDHALSRRVR